MRYFYPLISYPLIVVTVCTAAVPGQSRAQDPPPKSPLESLQAIQVRDGFRVELVAAEPLVKDPINLDWGPDGKLWIVEMADYNDVTPGGRIRVLEDTDGDRMYDRSTVFLDGLQNPTGVMPWRNGVLVSAAPEIFFAEDTNGDGRADFRELLYRGFGEGNQQHRVNGFAWGLDNWLYVANGDSGGTIESLKTRAKVEIGGRDLRIHPDTGGLQAQTGQTQFGRRRDDWGNWFSCSNPVPLRHMVLEDNYLRRNPHYAPPTPRRDIARSDNTQVFPLAEVISHWSGYRPPGAGESHRFTSASGICVYRDELFGPDFANNTFVCESIHNLVHRRKLSPDGVSFSSRRPEGEADREFLASSDSWFRPTTVRTGPDGALWITDMYRLAIEHTDYMSEEQKKQRDVVLAGTDRGRIYRVVPRAHPPRPIPNLHAMNSVKLVAALDSPNGWQRDTAQRLLIQRADRDAVPHLIQLLESDSAVARLHAFCTLDGLHALKHSQLSQVLNDPHPGVRRHAVRLCETRMSDHPELVGQLVSMADDDDPQVRLQLAYTLGESQDLRAARALAEIIMARSDEDDLMAAVMSSIGPHNLVAVVDQVDHTKMTSESLEAARVQLLEIATAYGESSVLVDALQATMQQQDLSVAWLRKLTRLVQVARHNDVNLAANADLAPRLRQVYERFRKSAADDDLDQQLRVALLELVGWLPAGVVSERNNFIAQFLDARYDLQLQSAAVAALGNTAHADVAQIGLARWSQLSPTLRAEVLDLLLTRRAWTEAFVQQLETGDLTAGDLSPSHQQRLLRHESPSIQQRARKILAGSARPHRAELVAQYNAVLTMQGDPARGQKLFVKHCAACHRIAHVGYAVGPDLLALKDRSPLAMLTAVLDPNRSIEDKYRTYTVITSEAQTFAGVVTAETSTSVTLTMKGGQQHVVLRRDIDQLVGSQISLMPEGLEKELKEAEMAELISYLTDLEPPSKAFPNHEPREIVATDTGVLELPASASRVYGSTLIFEARHRNLGYWQSSDDRATWSVRVPSSREYQVAVEYACDHGTANNPFVLSVGKQQLTGKVASTGTWDDYREVVIGQIHLDAGQHKVEFRAQGKPTGSLIDLRRIVMRPLP